MAQMKPVVIGAVGTGSVLYVFGLSVWSVLIIGLLWMLAYGGVDYLKCVVKTGPRDLWLGTRFLTLTSTMQFNSRNRITIIDLFEQTVRKHPEKVAVIFDEERWTFQQLDEYTNRVANHFLALGTKKGDVVALFMENCPEYVGTWVGLGKIGVVSAFINYNLRHDVLAHSIKVSNAKAIVFSASLGEALDAVLEQLDESVRNKCFVVKKTTSSPKAPWDAKDLHTELESCPSSRPPPPKDKGFEDHLCYIYTSGTTGLPKAVVIKHRKFFHMSWGHSLMMRITPNDVLYCTLPLYHSNGGVICLGSMLLRGCTLVLRKKFSASNFWIDCIKYNCTVVYYIGEICRYLLAQPARPTDAQHCVRMATGNGLRPNIWREFKTRFNIAEIGEFYGSTEGNVTVVNTTNKEGAVGNISVILPFVYPVTLLKVDMETGEYVRDRNGFCVKASFNEPGEIVGKIVKSNQLSHFDGYHDSQASEKKILRNVFKPEDAYFLSGDILRMDEEGYFYFCDRTGDTFRWKGENVSTAEVEAVVTNVMQHRDACCYGVEIPGAEGKAGMVTIVGNKDHDLSQLAQKLYTLLPPYAVPVFARIVPSVDLTGTFKIQKNRLRSEGYNINNVSDPLYVLDISDRKYVPLDAERYKQLADGTYRL